MKQKLGFVLKIIGIITLTLGFIGFAISGFLYTTSFGKTISPIVFFVIFFIGMIITAVSALLSASYKLGQFKNLEDTISNNIKEELKTKKQYTDTTCEYCGCTTNTINNTTCPNCGAKIKRIK